MDNLGAPKGQRVRELIEGRGCNKLPCLPPCTRRTSIRLRRLFKGFVRQIGARTREAQVEAIGKALDTVTAKDACSFFVHCGYHMLLV